MDYVRDVNLGSSQATFTQDHIQYLAGLPYKWDSLAIFPLPWGFSY
uniref:Uncharacterized protein n=1 Tax=viral metagenome TaxID=1070528 RepID=A0A6H2A3I1_9ZZZZ